MPLLTGGFDPVRFNAVKIAEDLYYTRTAMFRGIPFQDLAEDVRQIHINRAQAVMDQWAGEKVIW